MSPLSTLLDISVISTVIYCISPSIILQIPFTVNNCNTLCIMGIFCDVRPHIRRLTVLKKKLLYTTVFAVTASLAPFYWGCFIYLISYIWIDKICPTPCLQHRNSLGLTILDALHLENQFVLHVRNSASAWSTTVRQKYTGASLYCPHPLYRAPDKKIE